MKNTLKKLCATLLSALMLLSTVVVPAAANVSAEEAVTLPDSVDNSQSPYFPEIGNQGSTGACTSWAKVYYCFTYTMNKARGIKTTPENTYSPQWSYNFTSNGGDEGASDIDVEHFLEEQGAVPLSMVPYVGDHVTWCSDEDVWRESINNRVEETHYYKSFGFDENTMITSPDDENLLEVKSVLAKGDILSFSTNISSWTVGTIKTHKDAPENKKYAGEQVVTEQHDSIGKHAMTVVGYNDNIWTDINQNGKVDAGEMGAFKIANSWGAEYANDGFIWVSYDALNKTSCVEGYKDAKYRQQLMTFIEGIAVRPYGQGTDVYLKFNLKSENRKTAYVVITAEKDGTPYTYKAYYPKVTLYPGNNIIPYDGNMIIALDNVVPDISAENFSDYTWSVTFADGENDGYDTTYRSAEIVIESTGQTFKTESAFPFTLDGGEKTVQLAETSLKHAVVYYRGYYSPMISYRLDGGEWVNGQVMESNSEREEYVNKYVINLGNSSSAQVYFTDGKGNKDDNSGKYFTVTKGLNYFATEGVAAPIDISISFDAEKIEKNMAHTYTAEVKGGYAPYSYKYVFKELATGKEDEIDHRTEYNTCSKILNNAGKWSLTVIVTDHEGTVAEKTVEFEVIDSPFEFADFEVTNDGELFLGNQVNFRAVTKYEYIRRFSEALERYDVVIKKDGKEVYSAVIDPVSVNHDKMTSTAEFSWTPTEAGHYKATISGTDYGKDYAEKSIEFDVVNKAYIYYLGYYSPTLNYRTDGTFKSVAMESCTEEYGYVNKLVLDLGKAESADIYFTDAKGNKDDNGGAFYKVKAGKSYFVTKNACDPLKVELKAEKSVADIGEIINFTAKVSGGYSPYTYLYKIENKLTGEYSYSESSAELTSFGKAFDTEGTYIVTVCVTDSVGNTAEDKVEVSIITPTEATTATVPVKTEPGEETEPTSASEVTEAPSSTVDETEPSSAKDTTYATNPTEIVEEVIGIIGDTNVDGKVSIKDATLVQKHIANMDTGVELNFEIADCTKDGKVNIKDATLIQKYLAKYETENVGEPFVKLTVVTLPLPTVTTTTEAETTTKVVTTAPETTIVTEPTEASTATEPTETTAEPTEATTQAPTSVVTQPTTEVPTTEVTEPTTTESTEEVTEATEPTTAQPARIVTFTNSFNWSGEIKCYYWSDSNTAMTAWPGVAMDNAGTNGFGETLYTFVVPEGATYIIFTNGTVQTVDIPYSGGEVRFYPTSTTNDKGHYSVENW